MFQEYCDNHADPHQKRVDRMITPEGRLEVAQERADRKGYCPLATFILSEAGMHGVCMSARLNVFVPPWEDFNGKMVLELFTGSGSHLFFEIQIKEETDFSKVIEEDLGSDPWDALVRYHNVLINKKDAKRLLKFLLFADSCEHYLIQSSLMTIASSVLGSITTHDLLSDFGQPLFFRQCVLKL